ncbi:MAG: biotin attachment protein [Deltaproteobacteria bacterium]|nr:biotin attachment protein [Deltaproteobacteria bacterium]
MLDISHLLDRIKNEPYEEIVVRAPHCGTVSFEAVKPGDRVTGPSGIWEEIPGTPLAVLERERNKKIVRAPRKGELISFSEIENGDFVTAGTPLLTIRHYLTREEVLKILLREALHVFAAPEKGIYYFIPEVDTKIRAKGCRSVRVKTGEDLFILSRMKRETQIPYQGPEGIVYMVFFDPAGTQDAGQPLIGICPEDQLRQVEDVVARVQSEWEERN